MGAVIVKFTDTGFVADYRLDEELELGPEYVVPLRSVNHLIYMLGRWCCNNWLKQHGHPMHRRVQMRKALNMMLRCGKCG